MKKFIVISFIFLYLFSATEIHQLLKAPALFEHFEEHKSENKSLSFWNFLYEHYKNNSKDADYEKDMKLPFKTSDNCSQNILITLLTNTKIEIKTFHFESATKPVSVFKKTFFSSHYLDTIWQPPQFS